MSFKLARVAHRGLPTGEPLPIAYRTLYDYGVQFFRGGVSLIGGVPGSMKSTFVLNLIDTMKVPTLYISNDNDSATMVSRALAKRLQRDSRDMRDKAFEDPEWAGRHLEDMDYVRWNFSAAPTLEEIETELTAFDELYGEPPHVVVIDILMKVDYYEEGGGTLESIVRYMDKLAREYSCAVIIAAHTSENEPGNPTQPLKAFLQKIGKLPILALTTAYANGVFYLAAVKNRDGFADATGNSPMSFLIDPALATLEEL